MPTSYNTRQHNVVQHTTADFSHVARPSKGCSGRSGRSVVFAHVARPSKGCYGRSGRRERARLHCCALNALYATQIPSRLRTTTTFTHTPHTRPAFPTACQSFRPYRQHIDCVSARMIPPLPRPPANPSAPAARPTACQPTRLHRN